MRQEAEFLILLLVNENELIVARKDVTHSEFGKELVIRSFNNVQGLIFFESFILRFLIVEAPLGFFEYCLSKFHKALFDLITNV